MSLKFKDQIRKWLVQKLDLPEDIMLDLPRITLVGQLHIYIENHHGLISFTNEELQLHLKNGRLLIKGTGFVIKSILREEIIVEGKITQVNYIN